MLIIRDEPGPFSRIAKALDTAWNLDADELAALRGEDRIHLRGAVTRVRELAAQVEELLAEPAPEERLAPPASETAPAAAPLKTAA